MWQIEGDYRDNKATELDMWQRQRGHRTCICGRDSEVTELRYVAEREDCTTLTCDRHKGTAVMWQREGNCRTLTCCREK